MTLRSGAVLVPGDLSGLGVHAAWRGALVARELAAVLRLLHTRPAGEDPVAALESLRQLARDIRGHLGLRVEVVEDPGEPLAATARAARGAEMVVIGARRGNALRDLVLGTQAERLMRLSRLPVLVVKKAPTGGYRRVLVPVELGPAAAPVIAAAARLSRGPRLEVLHALPPGEEISMRVVDVPQHVLRRLRRRATHRAEAALEELIAQAAPAEGRHAAAPAVSFGDPAALVLARAQAMRADLVVMGKRPRGVLGDLLLNSVTRRVLAEAPGDVLMLPAPAPAGAKAIGLRLALRPACEGHESPQRAR